MAAAARAASWLVLAWPLRLNTGAGATCQHPLDSQCASPRSTCSSLRPPFVCLPVPLTLLQWSRVCCCCFVGWLADWPAGQLACVSCTVAGGCSGCSVGALGLAGAQPLPHRTPAALQLRRPHWGWILRAQWSPPHRRAVPTGAGAGKPAAAAAAVKWLLTPAALSTAAKLCRCLVL